MGLEKISNLMQHLKPEKEKQKMLKLAEAGRSAINYWPWRKHSLLTQHTELAGSLRRRKETIGDIELIIPAGVTRLNKSNPGAKKPGRNIK